MKNIVILDGYTENPGDLSWKGFEELGSLIVYDRTENDLILERAFAAEIVLTNKTPLSREMMQKLPKLEYIGVLATGYNVVDSEAAKELGIIVCNVPTYGTDAVAQFAIALLLEITSHIGHHSEAVRKGKWSEGKDWCFWDYPLIELAGKTMGIVGFGRIGQTTGRMARALGMHVIAYDSYKNPNFMDMYVTLEELFSKSDVISLHCPLLPETRGCINKHTIAQMKDGVIIINNSRGPLIVEQDLADALAGGKVYAAGLDVVSSEPIAMDNPLLHADNCYITPHISWAPKESRQRLMDIAVDNLKRFLEGHPVNCVNI